MTSGRGHVDYVLLGAVGLLLVLGAQMVYSSSVVIAHNEFGDETYFFSRQLIWIVVGLAGLGIAASIDYHRWQSVSVLLLLITVIALVLVLVPQLAATQYGSARWLRLGPLPSFQPSELAKLVVCIYMADWLSRKGANVGKLGQGSIPFVIILGIIAGLVVVEPDMGTAVIICAVAFSVFWVAGANLWHLAFGFIPGGAAMIWYVTHSAIHRAGRHQAPLDPIIEPLSSGWRVVQTLIGNYSPRRYAWRARPSIRYLGAGVPRARQVY